MLSKCRFDGAEGTEERVLALHTMLCCVREEGEVSSVRKDTTLNASLSGCVWDDVRCDEARERLMSRRQML